MKLSTKSRYALRAMMELGFHYEKGPFLLKDVARNQGISLKYLDHIFSALKSRGLIKSLSKGKGYVLSKAPNEITIGEIVSIFESCELVDCVEAIDVCDRFKSCGARVLWLKISSALREKLNSITLADAINEQNELAKDNNCKMYYI